MNTDQPPLTRWSFSLLKNFEACPYRVYLARVERVPEPPPADDSPIVRGEQIHLEAERFVRGDGPLTPALRKFATEFATLREHYQAGGRVELEQKWGFTQDWEFCSWENPACWALVKCDLVQTLPDEPAVVEIIDYKTGKRYGNEVKHGQQLQVYAIAAFMRDPNAALVRTALWYLDEGKQTVKTYTRPEVLQLLPRLMQRVERLTKATDFPPKPNKVNCKYCPYGVSNGNTACPFAVGDA